MAHSRQPGCQRQIVQCILEEKTIIFVVIGKKDVIEW
jgi:hypothetical protein